MKKRVVSFALTIILALSLCVPASAVDIRTVNTTITYREISIIINGTEIAPCDEKGNPTEPFIMNNTTYLPVRAIANALGLKVGWDAATSTVLLESGGEVNYGSGEPAATKATKKVDITYRGTKISLDGEPVALVNANGEAVEPFILDGTNYLPLRIVGEALGLAVAWDSATSTVTLTESSAEMIWALNSITFKSAENGGEYAEIAKLNFSYDGKGRITSFGTADKSQFLSCTYDSKGRLSTAVLSSGTIREEHAFVYGNDGELAGHYVNGELVEGHVYVKDEYGRIVKEDKIMPDGGMGRFEYGYDDAGRLVSSDRLRNDGHYDQYRYFYDEYGRLNCRWEYLGTGTITEKNATKYYLSYDENDRLIREEQYLAGEDHVHNYWTYEYDSEGNCVFESRFIKRNISGVYSSIADYYERDYNYGSEGNLISVEGRSYYCVDYEGDGEYGRRLDYEDIEKYEYDDEGRVAYQYIEVKDVLNDVIASVTENSWSYDSDGKVLEKSERTDSPFEPEQKYIWLYGYDSEGRVTEEKESYYYNSELLSETVSKYDTAGVLLEQLSMNSSGECTYSYVCEVDGQGRILSSVTINHGTTIFSETRNYNGDGLLVSVESLNHMKGTGKMAELGYVRGAAAEQDGFLSELMLRIVYSVAL